MGRDRRQRWGQSPGGTGGALSGMASCQSQRGCCLDQRRLAFFCSLLVAGGTQRAPGLCQTLFPAPPFLAGSCGIWKGSGLLGSPGRRLDHSFLTPGLFCKEGGLAAGSGAQGSTAWSGQQHTLCCAGLGWTQPRVFPRPGLLCLAAREFPAPQPVVSFCKSQPIPFGPSWLGSPCSPTAPQKLLS